MGWLTARQTLALALGWAGLIASRLRAGAGRSRGVSHTNPDYAADGSGDSSGSAGSIPGSIAAGRRGPPAAEADSAACGRLCAERAARGGLIALFWRDFLSQQHTRPEQTGRG